MPRIWRKVVYAADCEPCDMCEEPICPHCGGEHYADCECPGPHQDDEYEYREISGHLMARELPHE
jgi:hypothetical protein